MKIRLTSAIGSRAVIAMLGYAVSVLFTASPTLAQGPPRLAPVDTLAREAIISAVTGNDDALRQVFWNAQRTGINNRGISLSDAVYYLYNCTRANRDEFLSGQEILAANTKDKDWRNRILLSLLSDEVYELNQLEGQNRFNKYTRIFNRVSSSLSQLVMLQPQAAAALIWDGMYSLREGQSATIKERKMVYLCDRFLKKYPSAPERAEVMALRQELKQKMLADHVKELLMAGRAALSTGNFQLAEWHLEKAALLDPADVEAQSLLGNARTLKVRKEEIRSLTLGVSNSEARLAPAQAAVVGEIARALVTNDIKQLDNLRHNVPFVWDTVDYAYASVSEKRGDHAAALSRLQALATSAPNSPGGRAATRLLDNPNYNLNESYQDALAEMASEKNKFIWTGRRTRDETVYAGGSAIISSAGNPAVVPVLFGMDAAVRAISEKFRTQVSVDGVIDAGARYLRRYPDTPRAKEIARQLAELSKKAGDYDRIEEYLGEGGGSSPEEIEKINENRAIALMDKIKSNGDLLQRQRLIQELISKYPETKIARKSAAVERAKLPPALSEDTIVLPGSALKRDPQLASYLGIPFHVVDGNKGNGEVAEEGIAITPSADVVEFKLRKETHWRRGPLGKESREWILTAARQLRQEFLGSAEAQQLRYRQKLPFAIEGGVGSGGVDIAPQIIPHKTTRQDRERFQ